MGRGALIIIEGCDRAGKSTQVRMLVDALNNKHGLSAEYRQFPNRKTVTGILIDRYLKRQLELPRETAHCLFAANRWECVRNMIKTLESGTTIVVDRYAASGAAYGAVYTGKTLEWCKGPDVGLPKPDLVVFLKVAEESLESRSGWGQERFENKQFQQQVSANFAKLADETWEIVENRDIDATHSAVLAKAMSTIGSVEDSPVKKLWES